MSIQSEINRLKQNVTNTYTALSNLGATIPSSKTSGNLPTAVNSLSGKLNADTVDGYHIQVGSSVTAKTGYLTFKG